MSSSSVDLVSRRGLLRRAPGHATGAGRGWRGAVLAVALGLLASSPTAARGDDAQDAFQRGSALYGRGEFAAAANEFERADAIAPHPVARYNAALAHESAGDRARAADALESALADARLGGAQARDARERLKRLDAVLGRVEISAPEDATIDLGAARGLRPPLRRRIEPGAHAVTLNLADGERIVQDVRVAPGETAVVTFVAGRPPTVARTGSAPAAPASPRSAPPERDEGGLRGQSIAGIVVVSGAAAVTGISIGLGVAALDARDEWDASRHTDLGARDQAATLRTLTNVGFALGGAAAITGIVLLVTAPGSEASPTAGAAALRIAPTAIEVDVSF